MFLGPSLSLGEARTLLAADYRPPVRRGDLDRVRDSAVVIVIDGSLEEGHRLLSEEARQALERGVTLLGAASTGADLAAKLAGYGMAGRGRVFDLFCSGRIRTDDIAVLHLPDAPFTPITIPLVAVICWLDDLVSAKRLSNADARNVLAALRRLPLEARCSDELHRRIGRLLGGLAPGRGGPPLPDIKGEDARAILKEARRLR